MKRKNISKTKLDVKHRDTKQPIITLSWDEAMQLASAINPHQFEHLDDTVLTKRAKRDKNNPPLEDRHLDNGSLIPIPRLIKTARRKMRLNQADFALKFRLAVGTLRDWEQGRRLPDGPALAYLQLIAKDPKQVAALFGK